MPCCQARFIPTSPEVNKTYLEDIERKLILWRIVIMKGRQIAMDLRCWGSFLNWLVSLIISISQKVQTILKESGLKVATQNYSYDSAGVSYSGQNVYGIIQAPRGDATEAIVLVAAWKTIEEELNLNGVTLALSLARYFKSASHIPGMEACLSNNGLIYFDRMVTMVERHHIPHHTR